MHGEEGGHEDDQQRRGRGRTDADVDGAQSVGQPQPCLPLHSATALRFSDQGSTTVLCALLSRRGKNVGSTAHLFLDKICLLSRFSGKDTVLCAFVLREKKSVTDCASLLTKYGSLVTKTI